MGIPAFPRRKSTRRQKEGEKTREKNKMLARYPLTARTVKEKDAMLATNDGRGE
jgi:hypothetical protein